MPSRCADNGTDLVHAGPVDVIVGTDGPLSAALVQDDDEDGPGPAEARLTIGGGRVHLTADKVRELRAWCETAEPARGASRASRLVGVLRTPTTRRPDGRGHDRGDGWWGPTIGPGPTSTGSRKLRCAWRTAPSGRG